MYNVRMYVYYCVHIYIYIHINTYTYTNIFIHYCLFRYYKEHPFVSFRKVLGGMDKKYQEQLEMFSFHSVSKGVVGEVYSIFSYDIMPLIFFCLS